jgi:hypothetical protein
MALPSTAVIEVRTTGSDSSGGGFNSARGGTDYSQQDSPQATGTVTSSTTTVTATTSIFTSAMVGNYITDGTTWKEITAFTSATVVTVDSAPAWTAATIKVGGALATPGLAASLVVASNKVWIKSGTYAITSTSSNVSNGRVSITTGGTQASAMRWVGYGATRGDGGTKPVFQASGITGGRLLLVNAASACHIENITFDGNNQTGITGCEMFSPGHVYKCKAINCPAVGFNASAAGAAIDQCENSGGGVGIQVAGGALAYGCYSHGATTGYAPNSTNGASFVNCIASGNGNDFLASALVAFYINCSSYNPTTGSFNLFNCTFSLLANCSSANAGVNGFGSGSTQDNVWLLAFSAYSAGTSNVATSPQQVSGVTPGSAPYTNAAGGDFSPAAGSALRGAGILGAFPGGLSTGHGDIGAVQSASAGGLLVHPGMGGGMRG